MHDEDVMPVILELEDYEANLVVDALVEQRIRLMKNWEDRYRSPDENDGRYGIDIGKIGDLAMIDADIVTVCALRERLKDGIMVQRMCQEHALYPEKSVSVAWHHNRGWLPTDDFVETPIEHDQDQMSLGHGRRRPRISRATTGCSTSRIHRMLPPRVPEVPLTAALSS